LDLRPEGRPARSGFEVMLLDVIRQFGLRIPVRNYPVVVDGRVVAEIDLAYPNLLGALEANGARWHSTRRARLRDEERKALLRSLGWNVADFEWDEVVHHPEVAAARVRGVLCASPAP
jgi:very-short-patch-repair endonuclease